MLILSILFKKKRMRWKLPNIIEDIWIICLQSFQKIPFLREFPDHLMVRLYFHCQGPGLHPWSGNFPGGAGGKKPACQYRRWERCRSDPWVRKIPWRKIRQLTPVFLPGESRVQSYSPWVCNELHGHDWSDLACMHLELRPHKAQGAV